MKGLGAAPGGMKVYAALQRTVTKSTLPTQRHIHQKLNVGIEYLNELGGHLPIPWSEVTHIDIGAGWMPTIPMLFYSLGVDRQVLYDIRRNLSLDTVAATAALAREELSGMKTAGGFALTRMPPATSSHHNLTSYLADLGMAYRAPCSKLDLSATPGWKLITCTQVLLHLRYIEVVELLREVARSIRGGGIFFTTVHLYDLYADTDPALSRFNKFRYSEWVWDHLCTSRVMYFNRLTVSEYRTAFAEAGLRVLACRIHDGTREHLRALRAIKLQPRFLQVPEDELAAQQVLFMAVAAPTA